MAKKLQMTWAASSRRWRKFYKGKWYSISCKQLGTPKSKEASWKAANGWWEQTQREVDTAPPSEEDLCADAFKVWSMVQDWKQLDEESREKLVDSLVGAGQYQKIKAKAEDVIESAMRTAPPDRTINAQVRAWQQVLHGVCLAGQISEGRFDAYCRNIGKFVDWIGADTSIDAIDESKLEGFFTHMSVRVGAGSYSPSYAHTLIMTAKQFISRLAELRLIAMPGNIRSRRFRFNHSVPAKSKPSPWMKSAPCLTHAMVFPNEPNSTYC